MASNRDQQQQQSFDCWLNEHRGKIIDLFFRHSDTVDESVTDKHRRQIADMCLDCWCSALECNVDPNFANLLESIQQLLPKETLVTVPQLINCLFRSIQTELRRQLPVEAFDWLGIAANWCLNANQTFIVPTETKIPEKSAENAMFRRFARSSAQPLGMANLEGQVVFANPALTTYLEDEPFSRIESNRFVLDYYPEQIHPRLTETILPTVLNEGQWIGELPLKTITGKIRQTIQNLFLVRDDLGEPQFIASAITDITAHTQAKEALQQSEEQLRTLFKLAPDAVFLETIDGKLIECNTVAADMLGYTKEELIQMNLGDIVPQNRKKTFPAIRKALKQKGKFYGEAYLTRKTGEIIPVELSVRRMDLGGVDTILAVVRDISERKKAEEALRESERKFRVLAESTTAQIIIAQEDRILYANKAALDYYGMTMAQMSEITPHRLMSPEIDQIAHQAYATAKNRGKKERFRFEFCTTSIDGEERWYEALASNVQLDGKESWITTSFDITEQKRVQQALKESEQRYRAIFETACTAMIIFGDDCVITLANDEWVKLSGYTKEETENKLTWMPFFSSDTLTILKRYHEMRGRDPDSVPRAYEAQFIDRYGKAHHGIVNINMVEGTRHRVASFQDLTELRQAEQQMYRADKMAALGQIIAGVAHEINNPNNFIYFNLPILRRYIEAIRPLLETHLQQNADLKILNMPYDVFLADVYKLLENMEHGSKRITGIVSELKNYIRSDESQKKTPEKLDIVIRQVMALIGKQVRKTVKRFDVQIADDLPTVNMNTGKIEQVLINLVINAGQAADKIDSWVEIEIRVADPDKSEVEILVKDNGSGIPKEHLDLIFEPFFTSKNREMGTGLGLSISHQIIQEHHGTIRVESVLGVGSTFIIRLPAARNCPSVT